MFRQLRILFAILILLFVSASVYLTQQRISSWQKPLYVYIYPINADGSQATQNYIDRLSDFRFSGISDYMYEQSANYANVTDEPFILSVSPQVDALPPAAPIGGSVPKVMWWSMKLRFWSWTHNTDPRPAPDIQIYVLYYDPQNAQELPHSIGLARGQIGIVHAFSRNQYNQSNNVVIAHELMHTVGASDKYNLETDQPIHPQGYADPNRFPLYPQHRAELMGGRIPLSRNRSQMPGSLSNTIIGPITASEIRWDKTPRPE